MAGPRWHRASLADEWVKMRGSIVTGMVLACGVAAASASGVARESRGATLEAGGLLGAGIAVATSVAATLVPILAIVGALVSFSVESRNRMWSAGATVVGSLDRMVRTKIVLAASAGGVVVTTMTVVAVLVLAVEGAAPRTRAGWLEPVAGVLLVPILAAYWFVLTSLVVSLVRSVALAGVLVFLLAALEAPVAGMVGVSGVPLPVSASLALYPLFDYPPGGWVTPPAPVAVDPFWGAVYVLVYGIAGAWGTRSLLRVRAGGRRL